MIPSCACLHDPRSPLRELCKPALGSRRRIKEWKCREAASGTEEAGEELTISHLPRKLIEDGFNVVEAFGRGFGTLRLDLGHGVEGEGGPRVTIESGSVEELVRDSRPLLAVIERSSTYHSVLLTVSSSLEVPCPLVSSRPYFLVMVCRAPCAGRRPL